MSARRKIVIAILVAAAVLAGVLDSYAIVPKSKSNTKRQETFDKSLPNYLVAEKTLLGVVLLNNEKLLEVLPVLRAEDFFLPENKLIYAMMETMIASNKRIDLVTITQELYKSETLERAGGAAYLSQLADGVPTAMNVSNYAATIREKARLRSLIYAAKSIEEQAFAPAAESRAIVENAVSSMLALEETSAQESRVLEWNDVADRAVDNLRKAKNEEKALFRGRFGLAKLDETTSGLRKKELVLIVGPTGNGKSLLAQQLATTCDDDGFKAMIFSAEMSAESIVLRELAYDSDVFFYYLRRPESLDDEKIEKIAFASKRDREIAIVESGITPSRIWALAEARKRTKGLDLIIVDYDQLVISAGMNAADEASFFDHQEKFVHSAVQCAKRLDVCFVLLTQLRKAPPGMKDAKWKPALDDIYGASAMRNDPDFVIWIVREFFLRGLDKKYERDAKAYVVKGRNGATGTVKLDFDPRLVRFGDAREKENLVDKVFEEDGEKQS